MKSTLFIIFHWPKRGSTLDSPPVSWYLSCIKHRKENIHSSNFKNQNNKKKIIKKKLLDNYHWRRQNSSINECKFFFNLNSKFICHKLISTVIIPPNHLQEQNIQGRKKGTLNPQHINNVNKSLENDTLPA